MDWTQILTVIGSNLALFIWARTEANTDRREMMNLMQSMQDEMKDFHGRLCAIEERRINILKK